MFTLKIIAFLIISKELTQPVGFLFALPGFRGSVNWFRDALNAAFRLTDTANLRKIRFFVAFDEGGIYLLFVELPCFRRTITAAFWVLFSFPKLR